MTISDLGPFILRAYKSLETPDFRFVGQALKAGKHAEIADAFVASGLDVEDGTEPNTDVCRMLLVSTTDMRCCVQLSFVGPFAAVFHLEGGPPPPDIQTELIRCGFTLLSHDVLTQPCPFDISGFDGGASIYNLLFSEDEMPRSIAP